MADSPEQRRLLLVHAHPDDETIGTGATMAHYAALDVAVTLLTCTLGEEGEVLVPELAGLAADRADQLGGYRISELAGALTQLGVSDSRFLGGAGRWRDSGMMGTPANEHPRCFWQADPEEVCAAAVAVIREVRPQVLVTYDENGGYGHPDHIQAHRVAMAGFDSAADPDYRPDLGAAWTIAKVYWSALPRSGLRAAFEAMRESGETSFDVTDPDQQPMGTPDELVTTAVDAREFLPTKLGAMRAHATQILVDGPFFALSNNVANKACAFEHYQLVRGVRGPGVGEHGWESDLFSGVKLTPEAALPQPRNVPAPPGRSALPQPRNVPAPPGRSASA